jgi:hypothetical protein
MKGGQCSRCKARRSRWWYLVRKGKASRWLPLRDLDDAIEHAGLTDTRSL